MRSATAESHLCRPFWKGDISLMTVFHVVIFALSDNSPGSLMQASGQELKAENQTVPSFCPLLHPPGGRKASGGLGGLGVCCPPCSPRGWEPPHPGHPARPLVARSLEWSLARPVPVSEAHPLSGITQTAAPDGRLNERTELKCKSYLKFKVKLKGLKS